MPNIMHRKWTFRMFRLAREVSTWSKDPSTKVGAIIADDRCRVLGTGYNGFPEGVKDYSDRYEDRAVKYELVQHAEMNAMDNAIAPVRDATLFVYPLPTCSSCAKSIIQRGIKRVIFWKGPNFTRWQTSQEFALTMYKEAGVHYFVVDAPLELLDLSETEALQNPDFRVNNIC